MTKSTRPDPEQAKSPATFGDVTKEIARRNEEAQKAARARRAAREREEIALRRQWERL
jgi:hypothetical protein